MDVFMACVDGLEGFPEAIEAVYPETSVQLCLVHQVRDPLNLVSWKQRKEVAADLKPIYHASAVEEAEQRLNDFATKRDGAYPTISPVWRRNWERRFPANPSPGDPDQITNLRFKHLKKIISNKNNNLRPPPSSNLCDAVLPLN